MNKNTIIGFTLIGLIFVGFTFYQSKQYEKQQAYQAQLDSIAYAQQREAFVEDSIKRAQNPDTLNNVPVSAQMPEQSIYKDSLLESSSKSEAKLVGLENEKVAIVFSTKGAQPHSVRIKDFKTYDNEDLYLFKPGMSEMGYSVYTGENINTKDFVFELTAQTDSSVTMRLPFSGGGYIQQYYVLRKDSYSVDNKVSFVGMDNIIPKKVSSVDMDWKMTIPRMEKGFKNESQYSRVNYYFSGEKKPENIGSGKSTEKRIDNRLSWFAFQQQFFSAIMKSKSEFASGNVGINFYSEDNPDKNLMTCSSTMRLDYSSGADVNFDNEFYFGPNNFKILKSYDNNYEKIIPLGGWMVGWFTRFVIIPLFNFLHNFISNFGIIILLMTIFIKLVVLPLSYKSYSSSAKMQVIRPEIEKLNEKYPKQEDALKKQQATMDLYRRAGINPMGGCLPMLLQFPILWAMYRFFPASIELRQQSFLWADDLSSYDSLIHFGTSIPLLGNHISIFALLMAVSMFFYSRITMSGQTSSNDPNAASMKFMSLYMMPVMMFFICNSLSAGLSYYYLLSNIITMIETWIIKKWFVHPEEIMAKLKASEGKPAPKSKWQLRLEEAQKMQQQALKERQKKQGR